MLRQGGQIHPEPGLAAGIPCLQGDGPLRGAPLVVEDEIPLVGEATGAVQAEAGHVHRQRPLVAEHHLQGPGPADGLYGDLLSPLQLYHGIPLLPDDMPLL